MPVSVISLRVGSRLHPYQPEQDIRLIDGQRDCHWWITILLRQTVGYRNARVELEEARREIAAKDKNLQNEMSRIEEEYKKLANSLQFPKQEE